VPAGISSCKGQHVICWLAAGPGTAAILDAAMPGFQILHGLLIAGNLTCRTALLGCTMMTQDPILAWPADTVIIGCVIELCRCIILQLVNVQGLQLGKGAVGCDAAIAQDDDAIARWQVLPLMSHQQPCAALQK
jgi:hypothetical protein